MKLATVTFFAILFLSLSGAEALVDPYMGKNLTGETNESLAVFETLLNFNMELLEETMKHPLIPDSIQVQQVHPEPENHDDKKENETQTTNQTETQKPGNKKKKGGQINLFSVILSLIFSPFILMLSFLSFSYLVALCVFCIHNYTILFFCAVFIFLMILFWIME